MKTILLLITALVLTTQSQAQSNAPVRLAIVPETSEAGTAVDMLTAEFSKNGKVQLLERAEIDRIYREQGLSAANRDDLKLGRLLGADGLLLLRISAEGNNQFLDVRLVAVKPGVVLVGERLGWPMKDLTGWSPLFVRRLDGFLPKLAVLQQEAIPISVVNLRSAAQSEEAKQTEGQLKLLTIERLSREPRLFVLERQRMEMLGEEKALKSDESAFWDGSYLLEGTVDQNGYSLTTVTINARLTPPKGGVPIPFEVSGSRTNLAEVVNQLAAKVDEALKVDSSAPAWNAADEAQQYYNEAQWAMRWGVFSEAQSAAESAWALGKQDTDCATLRVTAYKNALPEVVQVGLEKFEWDKLSPKPGYRCVQVNIPPDARDCDAAIHALQHYYDSSGSSAYYGSQAPHQSPSGNDRQSNSAWHQLGLDTLTAAGQVLWQYDFNPQSQPPIAEKLADLRALARSVDSLISQSSSASDKLADLRALARSIDSFDRLISVDRLISQSSSAPDIGIQGCELNWGCFWQETPEDCVELYRGLMSSPTINQLHEDFWFRPADRARLAAWNDADRKRLARVWSGFLQEMDTSTNVILQMEGKAIKFRDATKLGYNTFHVTDATDEKNGAIAITNFFEALIKNRVVFVTNHIDWDFNNLIKTIDGDKGGGQLSSQRERLQKICSDYLVKLHAKDDEYNRIAMEQQNSKAVEKQIQYMKENKPFNSPSSPQEFAQLFLIGYQDYSKVQATEIKPYLIAFKSNLLAQVDNLSGLEKGWARLGLVQVGQVEDNVNHILDSPVSPTATHAQPSVVIVHPTTPAKPATVKQPVSPVVEVGAHEIVTNIITVSKCLGLPIDEPQGISAANWFENRLLLDTASEVPVYDNQGNWRSNATIPVIAILNPATEQWTIVKCPEVDSVSQSVFYHRSVLWHGDIYNCNGYQIRRYNFQGKQWQSLKIYDGNNYELFVVNDRLYAANGLIVFEITENGNSTRILASARRNPPASTLDREDLGNPTLFEGPDHSLRVRTANKIFTWMGSDWREDCPIPPNSAMSEIFPDGVLFRAGGTVSAAAFQPRANSRATQASDRFLFQQDTIFCLGRETNVPVLCLEGGSIDNRSPLESTKTKAANTFWKMPANLVPNQLMALRHSDLYILEDSSAAHTIVNDRHEIIQDNQATNDNYNAVLLCFSSGLHLPAKIYLKFGSAGTTTPTWLFPTTNFWLMVGWQQGVWLLPTAKIDSAIAAQRPILLARYEEEQKQARAAEEALRQVAEQQRQERLAKYDRNHNGIIDPDDREEALDDPAFIESELDTIDANHNRVLDPEELAYFDANQNKILDPKEQAGIDLAQHLLAERWFKQFDADGDGVLDQFEFADFQESVRVAAGGRILAVFGAPSVSNNNGGYDLNDVESSFQRQTLGRLQISSRQSRASFPYGRSSPLGPRGIRGPVDPKQSFKAAVEAYWQPPNNATNNPAGIRGSERSNGVTNP